MHGWLSPNGEFYSSFNLLTHFDKASEIVDWDDIKFEGIDPLTSKRPWCAERILEILGWIKIGSEEKIDIVIITDEQVKFIYDNILLK